MSITVYYKSILSFLVSVARHVEGTQNNKCEMPLNISKRNWVMKLIFLHADKYEHLTQVDRITFCGFGQACPKYPGKFALSLWHLKKDVRNKVRDLTALIGSDTTLKIYYTFNVVPPSTLLLSQCGIHIKLFLHLINCLCNLSSLLLFQVTVGLYKLACLFVFVIVHFIIVS